MPYPCRSPAASDLRMSIPQRALHEIAFRPRHLASRCTHLTTVGIVLQGVEAYAHRADVSFSAPPIAHRPTPNYGRVGTVTSRSGDIPSASAWKFTTTRWLSTGTAIALTSSRSGTARPSIAARALAPRMRYCEARGPAPQLTYFLTWVVASSAFGRVERASRTA